MHYALKAKKNPKLTKKKQKICKQKKCHKKQKRKKKAKRLLAHLAKFPTSVLPDHPPYNIYKANIYKILKLVLDSGKFP